MLHREEDEPQHGRLVDHLGEIEDSSVKGVERSHVKKRRVQREVFSRDNWLLAMPANWQRHPAQPECRRYAEQHHLYRAAVVLAAFILKQDRKRYGREPTTVEKRAPPSSTGLLTSAPVLQTPSLQHNTDLLYVPVSAVATQGAVLRSGQLGEGYHRNIAVHVAPWPRLSSRLLRKFSARTAT